MFFVLEPNKNAQRLPFVVKSIAFTDVNICAELFYFPVQSLTGRRVRDSLLAAAQDAITTATTCLHS